MISDELGSNVPKAETYRRAFLAIRDQLTNNQLKLLRTHYSAPERTIKPVELAKCVGYSNYSAVNLQYGLLAKRMCDALDLRLRFHIQALIIFVHPDTVQDEPPKWIMRPQVAQALQELGWGSESASLPFEAASGRGQSVNEAKRVISSLLPQKEKRELCLEMFVESINHANSYGSDKWGAYYEPNIVRLLVGSFIVFTIEKEGIWLALDKESIEASKKIIPLLETNGWQWDEDDYPMYSKIPSRNGYYTPLENHSEMWPLIKELHFEFIGKVAAKYKKLRKDSQAKHSSTLVNFLRNELGQFVPDPIYEQVEEKDDFALPDEILEGVSLYEGSKQRITVNAYERNPQARKACIAHYGTRCQVCGLDFGEKYGQVGKGIIYVHHLRPLSDVGEEYKVDPIRDLVPVCPNCHAVIHKQDPPYTIEEVRGFVRLAGEATSR